MPLNQAIENIISKSEFSVDPNDPNAVAQKLSDAFQLAKSMNKHLELFNNYINLIKTSDDVSCGELYQKITKKKYATVFNGPGMVMSSEDFDKNIFCMIDVHGKISMFKRMLFIINEDYRMSTYLDILRKALVDRFPQFTDVGLDLRKHNDNNYYIYFNTYKLRRIDGLHRYDLNQILLNVDKGMFTFLLPNRQVN